MEITIENIKLKAEYLDFGKFKIKLKRKSDILYFKNWLDIVQGVTGTLVYKRDYVKDIEYVAAKEKGIFKNCFPCYMEIDGKYVLVCADIKKRKL